MPLRDRAHAALTPPLRAALASGATIVTPNKRLARRIAALYDREQQVAGRIAWTACTVLPWAAWLELQWLETLATCAIADPPVLLHSAHAGYLWREIVARDATPLIDGAGAAALAAEAWDLVHAWGAGGESWRGFADAGEDPAAFARWADAYASALARRHAVDSSQLPDRIARAPSPSRSRAGTVVGLAGFVELSPQQERLLAALTASGARVERLPMLPAEAAQVHLASGATPRDEIARALLWARERAEADPAATIGIAVADLPARRDEIATLAEEILCPALQWPGERETARPYNLSLGAALNETPIVAAAIGLIALAHGRLPVSRAATLVRSPYLPEAEGTAFARGAMERRWLEEGRVDVSLADAIETLSRADPPLAERWRAARASLPGLAPSSPRAWSEAWRTWLEAAGWPGGRSLSSPEFQARRAWDEALARFALLGPVAGRLRGDEAVRALEAIAGATVFQPEAPEAPVQILGVLEAAALPLDALWVAGLSAESWPQAPRPHPLLPSEWQRDRGAPHATPARELAYATALTAQFVRAAREVVLSHPREVDDHARSPSLLLPAAPVLTETERGEATAWQVFVRAPGRERVDDTFAPPIPNGVKAAGGTGLIEAQADCPFKAMATHRLRAEAWPEPLDGLSPMERGALVHAALAAFWREVGSSDALTALATDALTNCIRAAVEVALNSLPRRRWQALPPVVQQGEGRRLEGQVRAWLDDCERGRPPFAVREVEAQRTLALGGITLDLRIDRVDALGAGGTAIIDYKTGIAVRAARWFDPRPRAPQLGLYALACRATSPAEPVRAVAFGQVRPGEMRFVGLAADAEAWPALGEPSDLAGLELRDWDAVEARWAHAFEALAGEISRGFAAAAPRDDGKVCAQCSLASLCRIGAVALDAQAEATDG